MAVALKTPEAPLEMTSSFSSGLISSRISLSREPAGASRLMRLCSMLTSRQSFTSEAMRG